MLFLLDLPANEKYRRCSQWQSPMVRIAITEAAFAAIAATLPLGSVVYEPKLNEKGERLIWIERC